MFGASNTKTLDPDHFARSRAQFGKASECWEILAVFSTARKPDPNPLLYQWRKELKCHELQLFFSGAWGWELGREKSIPSFFFYYYYRLSTLCALGFGCWKKLHHVRNVYGTGVLWEQIFKSSRGSQISVLDTLSPADFLSRKTPVSPLALGITQWIRFIPKYLSGKCECKKSFPNRKIKMYRNPLKSSILFLRSIRRIHAFFHLKFPIWLHSEQGY